MHGPARRSRRARGRGQGFTLVELLVSVAIVAVLMGVLIPSVGLARRTALGTHCLSNMRAMTAALNGYLNVHAEQFPISSHTTGDVARADAWVQSLVPYGFAGDVRTCPADPYAASRPTSYATNTYFEPLVAGIDFDPFGGQPLPGGRTRARTRLAQVPYPDRTFWAVEVGSEGFTDHVHAVGWTSSADVAGAIEVHRHDDHANYAYPDGHVAPVGWDRLSHDFDHGINAFNPETP